ncbi:hypothetical protein HU719_003680 [Pseudomonas sp. SWRI107]|uniref:hypothetical protein n=1 Tax=Pseudomonas farsensis TaxID=2745492 RepID=UPI001645F58C|nr:hypothetical protein [Pseudomonas farsensis]MBV4530522.1 hypothetical protein [Pseudomonas farsensis]
MKLKGSFDARRLRPREPGNWGARLAGACAFVLCALGLGLAFVGLAGLLGHYPAFTELNANRPLAATLAVGGLLVLYLGVRLWRRSRVRRAQGLNMSPHLMKKHD